MFQAEPAGAAELKAWCGSSALSLIAAAGADGLTAAQLAPYYRENPDEDTAVCIWMQLRRLCLEDTGLTSHGCPAVWKYSRLSKSDGRQQPCRHSTGLPRGTANFT